MHCSKQIIINKWHIYRFRFHLLHFLIHRWFVNWIDLIGVLPHRWFVNWIDLIGVLPIHRWFVNWIDLIDWLIDWSHWWWPSFRFIDCLSIGSIWLIDWLVDWSHRWWTLSFQFIDGIDIRNPRRKTTFKSRKSIWNKNMILSS